MAKKSLGFNLGAGLIPYTMNYIGLYISL
jgi:hypothetical protein